MINQNEYDINIAIFEQLEQVFSEEAIKVDQQKFEDNKKKFFTTLNNYGYKNAYKKIKKFSELFEGFEEFKIYTYIQSTLKLNSSSTLNPYVFFLALFNENTEKKPIDILMLGQIRQLISLQKNAYIRNNTTAQTPTEHGMTVNTLPPKTRFQTCAPYIKPSFMMVAGSGLALFGGMLQFNAQFALWVGLQLHPALLAALVIGGMIIAGIGINNAIGKYQAHSNPIAGESPVVPTQVSRGIYFSLLNRFGSFGLTREQPTPPLTTYEKQTLTSTTPLESMSR